MMPGWADRARDRPARRPPNLLHAPGDRPGPVAGVALALQQMALQSVYWLLPPLVGAAYGMDAAGIASLVALALLGSALAAVLQCLTRGPVGSGYGMPNVPTPIFLGAYLVAAGGGLSLGAAGAAMILAAVAALVLFLGVPRLLSLIPPELTGLVVFMIGVGLLPRAIGLLTEEAARGLPEHEDVAIFALALLASVAAATTRWPLARFALIIGGAAGTVAHAAVHPADPVALAALAAAPWFGLPAPVLPEFGGVTPGLFLAFLIATICLLPDWLGDMTTYQRAADANWTKPDTPPLRRGILAGILGVIGAGAIGGFGPSTSSACVGLGIATRSLSRHVALTGAGLTVLLALSPKLIALFVLIPGPAAAAMVAYVSAFMATSGATLIASRVLDVRRTCAVGLGLLGGLGVLVAPELFERYLPGALASPVTLAFTVAFVLHLATLPGVTRRAVETLPLDRDAGAALDRFVEGAAGALGLRRATADAVRHALLETVEVLARRGAPSVKLRVGVADDVVRAVVAHPAPPLPAPAAQPRAVDLEAGAAAEEAFAMWLAAREALACTPRAGRGAASVEFEFRD
jgi:NCS2 family nucleobase:cation symporter-2